MLSAKSHRVEESHYGTVVFKENPSSLPSDRRVQLRTPRHKPTSTPYHHRRLQPKTLAPARPVSTTEPEVAAPILDDHPISITQPKPPSHKEQLPQGGVPPVKDTLHGHCHQSLQDSRMIEYNEHMYIDGLGLILLNP